MKKALSINLAGIVYPIDEDAYQKLDMYFATIKNHFSTNPDKEEIINDIERSIAEKFTGRLSTTRQVVTIEDVQTVIQEMGDTKDFSDGEEVSTQEKSPQSNKKLFRDSEKKVIAGVLAGLAAFYGIEVVWLRIISVILLLSPAAFFVIAAYFVLWVSMPEAKNTIDKIQMQGEPISLTSIESAVKNKLGETTVKEESLVVKLLLLPFRIVAIFFGLLKSFAPILMKISGVLLILISIISITAASTFAAATAFFPHLLNMPFRNFPGNISEYSMIGLMYGSVIIPLIFIIVVAVSLIKKKNLFNTASFIVFFTIWMIMIAMTGLVIANNVPTLKAKYRNTDTKKEFPVTPFTALDIKGAYKIELVQGEDYKVVAQGGEEEINTLKVSVIENALRIEETRILSGCIFFCRREQRIIVTVPSLERINMAGATDLQMEAFNIPGDINISLTGASEVYAEQFTARNINLNIVGSSDITLQGSAQQLQGLVTGASNVDIQNLKVAIVEMQLSGSSEAEVYATDSLTATVSGASDLYYIGKPATIKKNVSGSGSVEPMDQDESERDELEVNQNEFDAPEEPTVPQVNRLYLE